MVTKPRNAAGRFAAAQAEVPKRSASDRHIEAKQALPKLEAERDGLMGQWRASLLDDDESAVECCERQLDVVERKLRRSQALIDLLPPQIQREKQQRESWPSSLDGAQLALTHLEPWLMRLQSIPKLDRSAAVDQQIDHLVQRQYALRKLITSLQPDQESVA